MVMELVWKLFSALLFYHLAYGQSSQDLILNSIVALESDFQKVTIECSKTGELPFHDNLEYLPYSAGGESNYKLTGMPAANESKFELLINGSTLNSEITTVINYTAFHVEGEGVRVNFYLSKYEKFYGSLICNHLNQSQQATVKTIASASLTLLYVPYKQESNDMVWVYLAIAIFILFLTLFLHGIFAFAIVKFKRNRKHYLEGDSIERTQHAVNSSAISEKIYSSDDSCTVGEKQMKSPCSDSCLSQEEATNALLKYLAHPTPCMEDSCPCYRYKEALQDYKLASAKSDSKIVTSSNALTLVACDYEIETDSCVDTRKKSQSVLPPFKSSHSASAASHNTTGQITAKHTVVYPKIHDKHATTHSDTGNTRDSPSYFESPRDLFVVGYTGGTYSNEDHQVYLRVPEGAIPKGKTITISIGVSLTSSKLSLLPSKSQPVSPVASFHVEGEKDFEFLKPVEITLPHFVDIEDDDDVSAMELAFLKSSCNLYCFHQSSGAATFKPKSQIATLRTTHFCSFCIAASKKVPTEKIHYRLVKIVPRLNHQQEQWRANYCVTYYLRTCLEALKKQYPECRFEVKPLKRFKFPKSEHISIYFERRHPGGWQLALETSDKIYAKSVEYQSVEAEELEVMEEEGQYPPRFEVLVCSSQARETVNAHIQFKGIVTDGDSSDGMLTELVLQPHLVRGHMKISHSMPIIDLSQNSPRVQPHTPPFPGQLAAYPSHRALMSRVAAHLPSKWRLVGIQLGLSVPTLDLIESYGDCMRCFSSVFSNWKSQGTAPYCWNTIIDVLKSSLVQENVVAVKLEEELKDCFGSNASLCSTSTASSSGYQSGDYSNLASPLQ